MMLTATKREANGSRHILGDTDVQFIADLIHSETGVRLNHTKKTMIQARLIRRMQTLRLSSLDEYVSYLRHSPDGVTERSALVDILTTHKTDFFRERHHFDYLLETALPSLHQPRYHGGWRLWSAGCSTGEEAWTLAMVLANYFGEEANWRFRILATDISEMVVDRAMKAVYPRSVVETIPFEYRRFVMHGRGRQAGNIRVVPELRKMVTFNRESLLDPASGGNEPFEIIFCRNVVIYFDRDATALLVKRLVRRLVPGGYLFIGHSETLDSNSVGLQPVAPTVFRKT
ncbi:MAG: protein-glutamate O-methyltransferase CheR [Alphaproteobacteria bacterium]|nr:protein-glutamate O-methyltransferase CheR [Alphaproteobacteria bacterium]